MLVAIWCRFRIPLVFDENGVSKCDFISFHDFTPILEVIAPIVNIISLIVLSWLAIGFLYNLLEKAILAVPFVSGNLLNFVINIF